MLLPSIMHALNDDTLGAQAKASRLRQIMGFEEGQPIPLRAVQERLHLLLEEEFTKVKME